MELKEKQMVSGVEYRDFAEKFYYLVDGEIKKGESLRTDNDHHDLALLLPKLISIVNVAGYLRGQDNRFIGLRPMVNFQDDLYRKEGEFENRLFELIKYAESTDSKQFLKDRVGEYYFKNRGIE